MTSLTLVREIAAPPSVVFAALTTPAGIACWWGPDGGPVLLAETDLRVGGRFRVRFRTLDGAEHESSGEFLEVVAPQRLAMTWQWGGQRGSRRVSRRDCPAADGGGNPARLHPFAPPRRGEPQRPRGGLGGRSRQAATASATPAGRRR